MGIEMQSVVLVLPEGQTLDWDAAAETIRGIRLDWLWDAANEYFNTGDFTEDEGEEFPGAVAGLDALRAAQSHLRDVAQRVRYIVERGWPSEVILVQLPHHRLWLSAGASLGDPATDAIGDLAAFWESGIAATAGFTTWTDFGSKPFGQRRLPFTSAGKRATLFGVVAGHAAESAMNGEDDRIISIVPSDRFEHWAERIDRISQGGDPGGQALLRFAAEGLDLCGWLREPWRVQDQEFLDELARDMAMSFDERLVKRGRPWRSHQAAASALQESITPLRACFDLLDETHRVAEEDDQPVDEDLAARITTGPVGVALMALTDLHGWTTGDLRSFPS